MGDIVLKIDGFDELIKALETMPETAKPLIEEAMTKSLAQLHDTLAEYPPSTAANKPGRMHIVKRNGTPHEEPMGYYERGQGWWSPIKRPIYGPFQQGALGKRAGLVRTKKPLRGGVVGYRLTRSSENLGKKWTTAVASDNTGVIGEIGTTVSYANYVQGDQQPALFGMRGWKTLIMALEDAQPQIIEFFSEAADKLIEDFNSGK